MVQCSTKNSREKNDESVKTLFNTKGAMAWLCDETETKYSNLTSFARKLLVPSPSPYLAEYGFSVVNYLLLKKRHISKRGDLNDQIS